MRNKALELLNLLDKSKVNATKINKSMEDVFGRDFPPRVCVITDALEDKLVKLLDEIFGQELASYYLYDCVKHATGERNGLTVLNGKDFPIRNIDDVRHYLDYINDKCDIIFECMEANNFNIDDLAKLLCRVFKRMCDEVEIPKSDIQKVFYDKDKKFTLKIEMIHHEI